MSIHPLVLATLENMRTRAELRAEVLRSQREATTTASTSGQSQAMAIGRRLREADAIAGSWLQVLAAVAAADDDAPVPDPLVCEVAWHTHLETPVTEECVRSVPEKQPAPAERVVGYRLNKRLRCIQHPFQRSRSDTAVTAQELPDGGFCELTDCGRDLLA